MAVARECADNSTSSSRNGIHAKKMNPFSFAGSPFFINSGYNMFASTGCDGIASLYDDSGKKISGCSSTCNGDSTQEALINIRSDGCNGYFCCQSNIGPSFDFASFQGLNVGFSSMIKPGSCRTAFIISDGFINFNGSFAATIPDSNFVPVEVSWTVHLSILNIMKGNLPIPTVSYRAIAVYTTQKRV